MGVTSLSESFSSKGCSSPSELSYYSLPSKLGIELISSPIKKVLWMILKLLLGEDTALNSSLGSSSDEIILFGGKNSWSGFCFSNYNSFKSGISTEVVLLFKNLTLISFPFLFSRLLGDKNGLLLLGTSSYGTTFD